MSDEQRPAGPKVWVIDPEGTNPGDALFLRGCLTRGGYETTLLSPSGTGRERIPAASLKRALWLGVRRLSLKLGGIYRFISISDEGLPFLPKDSTLVYPSSASSPLLRGFALGEVLRSWNAEEEGQTDGSTTGITVAVPGAGAEESTVLEGWLRRISGVSELFRKASVTLQLFEPLDSKIAALASNTALASTVSIRPPTTPEAHVATLQEADALLNIGPSTTFWAAALNRPIVTSTSLKVTPELRSLSVYFTGGHIEQIAEKVLAGHIDRGGLSNIRISPHVYGQAAAASFKEERARLEAALADGEAATVEGR